MDKMEQFEREYYEAYIARNNKHREHPIALIHAIIDGLREYDATSYEVVERSIRRDWLPYFVNCFAAVATLVIDTNKHGMILATLKEY